MAVQAAEAHGQPRLPRGNGVGPEGWGDGVGARPLGNEAEAEEAVAGAEADSAGRVLLVRGN